MNVCIVGNSDNVLGQGLGNKIDDCDVVIRINDFLLENHKEDIGSKTSIIATAFSGANKIACDASWPTQKMLKNTDVWMVRPLRDDRVSRAKAAGVDIKKMSYPSSMLYETLIADVYSKFWRKEPSSGLVTISMAIEKYPDHNILICGFDSNTGKEGKRHYFDPNYFDIDMPNDPVGHDWESENLYIEELISNRQIRRMT